MYRIYNENGFIVYRATIDDLFKIGGFGICDNCGEMALEGYLVPILNSYLCQDCYDEWCSYADTYHEEDRPIELRSAHYYEKMIGLEEEMNND